MSAKVFYIAVLLCCIISFVSSCNKVDNNGPITNSPLLVLTPLNDSGYSGDQVGIDYAATAANGIKRIQIFTQFLALPRVVVKDSFLSAAVPSVDQNFIYTIPDSARRGNQAFVTVLVTDAKGNAITKVATVATTGSRPFITITPVLDNANAGDTVVFRVMMKSLDKPIQTLDISQTINNGSTGSIQGEGPFSNRLAIDTIYKYPVPTKPTVNGGDIINLIFKVTDSNGINNQTTATVRVN